MKLQKGRQIKHSAHVDLESIESVEPNKNHRQLIKFRYLKRKSKNIATVVLMNPSGADKMMADNTIRRVEDVLFHLFKNIAEVRVFNLFSVRGKNPADVNDLFEAKGIKALLYKGTDDLLQESINESEVAIAAWGGPCGINKKIHAQRVESTLSIMKNCKKLYRVAGGHYSPKAAYPLHGRLWSYAMKPYRYKV